MRIIQLIIASLSLVLTLFISCNRDAGAVAESDDKTYQELPSKKFSAVAVNNQVSSIQKGTLVLVDSIFKSDTASLTQKVNDAIFELEVNISRLKSLGEENETANYFSESVINLLEFYKSKFEGDFKGVISVLKKDELSNDDQQFLSEYDEAFVKQEMIIFNEIVLRQDSFANYFQIGLTN